MHLWMDSEGRMMTDEQLLRYLAYYGSLEDALRDGNIRLISDTDTRPVSGSNCKALRERRLSDYLQED